MLKSNCKKKCILVAATIIAFSVNGCVPLLIGAGVGTAGVIGGKVALQDKTVGESVSDTTIWTKIRTSFLRNKIAQPGDISIEVTEGRVLLTGFVQNEDEMIKALKIVWAQTGVREVINELKVRNRKNESSAFDDMKDTWITAKIKTKMLLEPNIKSTNYTIETINCTVYIFGIAQDNEELTLVQNVAENVTNTKKVVSYVRIRKNLEERVQDTVGKHQRETQQASEDKLRPQKNEDNLENIFDE